MNVDRILLAVALGVIAWMVGAAMVLDAKKKVGARRGAKAAYKAAPRRIWVIPNERTEDGVAWETGDWWVSLRPPPPSGLNIDDSVEYVRADAKRERAHDLVIPMIGDLIVKTFVGTPEEAGWRVVHHAVRGDVEMTLATYLVTGPVGPSAQYETFRLMARVPGNEGKPDSIWGQSEHGTVLARHMVVGDVVIAGEGGVSGNG